MYFWVGESILFDSNSIKFMRCLKNKAVILVIFLVMTIIGRAQDFSGVWYGYPRVFEISRTADGYTGISYPIDHQDQARSLVRVKIMKQVLTCETDTGINGWRVMLQMQKGGVISATLADKNSQQVLYSDLSQEPFSLVRPQTPKAPFSYQVEDVSFQNAVDGVRLSGTLTLPRSGPNKTCKAVVLLSGSGPNDRNSEGGAHEPYQGFAVETAKFFIRRLEIANRHTPFQGENNEWRFCKNDNDKTVVAQTEPGSPAGRDDGHEHGRCQCVCGYAYA